MYSLFVLLVVSSCNLMKMCNSFNKTGIIADGELYTARFFFFEIFWRKHYYDNQNGLPKYSWNYWKHMQVTQISWCIHHFFLCVCVFSHLFIDVFLGRFTCNTCRKSYKNRTTLCRHIRLECNNVEPKFQCDICFRLFRHRHSMLRHKISHLSK